MKVSTYNKDGSLLLEEEFKNLLPESFAIFSPDRSIMTIEEDDLNLLNTKGNSLKKTLLLNQFSSLFQIEYNNYLGSGLYEKYNTFFYNNFKSISDELIINGYNELSELLKSYSRGTLENENILYSYNNESKHKYTYSALSTSYWFDVLFYCALRRGYRRFRHPDTIPLYILTSFLNLINRYYYILRKIESLKGGSDILKNQIITLAPYANLHKRGERLSLNTSAFLIKILNSLFKSSYSNLQIHYSLIAIINGLAHKVHDNSYLMFEDLIIKKEDESCVFKLDDYARNPKYELSLTDSEISGLYLQDENNKLLIKLRTYLQDIEGDYLIAYKEKFENQVLSNAEEFFELNETNNWKKYKFHYVHEIKKLAELKNPWDPDECYYTILFDNDNPYSLLSITNKCLIADLFTILKKNKSTSQYHLYKGIISLNFIKSKYINQELPPTIAAIEKAKKYINIIYNGRIVIDRYKESIKTLIDDFFLMHDTKIKITDIAPRKFDGGFNLKLVYNFIGILISKGIITESAKKTDLLILKEAYKDGLTTKPVAERKHDINDYSYGPIADYQCKVNTLVDGFMKGQE